ncbi:COX15/CtaA family protein [Chloroflexota bacterium]
MTSINQDSTNFPNKYFARYAWFVLVFNIFVILWGAVVRATGSGAGCGNHWPSCNGEVIPPLPQIETLIEFTHRLTSGLAFLFVLVMLIWALRVYPKGHHVRKASGAAMIFIISESLVGAGLVLFEWVAGNISTERIIVMGIHLLNTHLLLGAIVLAAWWASGGKPLQLSEQSNKLKWRFVISIIGVLVLSMVGAVTALGDTLFPAETLVEGILQDLSPASHFIVRLRIWHPVIAAAVGLYLIKFSFSLASDSRSTWNRRFAIGLGILFAFQLAAGMVNLILLAPVWMQIIHLLLADLVWIFLILLAAETLSLTTAVNVIE